LEFCGCGVAHDGEIDKTISFGLVNASVLPEIFLVKYKNNGGSMTAKPQRTEFELACYKQLRIDPAHPVDDATQKRLALAKWMNDFSTKEGRQLNHLVVTYRASRGFVATADIVNGNFIRLYLSYLLPTIVSSKHYNKNSHRRKQPIVVAFLERHKQKPSTKNGNESQLYLHHHAILALHASTVDRISGLNGQNTLVEKCKAAFVRTSFIRPCDALTTLYASKQLKTYPEFLCFPDRAYSCDISI
jgi:hypothetical protein